MITIFSGINTYNTSLIDSFYLCTHTETDTRIQYDGCAASTHCLHRPPVSASFMWTNNFLGIFDPHHMADIKCELELSSPNILNRFIICFEFYFFFFWAFPKRLFPIREEMAHFLLIHIDKIIRIPLRFKWNLLHSSYARMLRVARILAHSERWDPCNQWCVSESFHFLWLATTLNSRQKPASNNILSALVHGVG